MMSLYRPKAEQACTLDIHTGKTSPPSFERASYNDDLQGGIANKNNCSSKFRRHSGNA